MSKPWTKYTFFYLLHLTVAMIPKIDLAVIIGAYSDPTFTSMKNTINAMIDHYSTNDARYSLITSGSDAQTTIHLSDDLKSAQAFKDAVTAAQRPKGNPDLRKALDMAQATFKITPSRPGVKKILVVMIDQKSVNYPQVLVSSGKRLEDAGVVVVPVAFGALAHVGELTRLAPSRGVVIKVKGDEDPGRIAQRIMHGVTEGKCYCCCLWWWKRLMPFMRIGGFHQRIASTTLISKVCRVFYRNFIFRHLLYVAKGTEIVLELKFT